MKRIIEKINSSKILFTIFISIIFVLFLFITSDIALFSSRFSSLIKLFNGLFSRIYNSTYYGKQMMGELFWLLLLFPVIFLFGNKYIFTQKREKTLKSILEAWPILAMILVNLISSIIHIYKAKSFDIYEFIALIIFNFLIGMFEEYMCRGWIQNEFIERFGDTRKNVIFSIVVSSLLFGFMHITNAFIGTQSLTSTLLQIVNATIIGLALGSIYYKCKNIWVVVLLHASWDFALFLSEINYSTTCLDLSAIESQNLLVFLMGLFAITVLALPNITAIKLFMNKKTINEQLPKKNQEKITDLELNKINKKEKEFVIVTIIFLILFAGIEITSTVKDDIETDCPLYNTISIENNDYSEHYLNYKEYEFNNNLANYIIKSKNDKLIIENELDNKKIMLKFNRVLDLLVINNDDEYDVYFINVDKNNNYLVYNLKVTDNMSIDDFENSIELVKLPDIYYLGYYQENESGIKYPLFRNNVNDRFILKDDVFYRYKINY